MTWEEALEIVLANTKHELYRDKCNESNPKYEFWRKRMIDIASGNRATEQKVAISTGSGGITTINKLESIQLTNEMKSCPHYEKNSTCGCGKALCKIGKGESDIRNPGFGLVSWWDCAHCLRPEVELYAQNCFKKKLD